VKSAAVALALFVLALSAQTAAAAELAGGTLGVRRDEATSDCPDATTLACATLALGRSSNAPRPALDVEVTFRRESAGYVAQIRTRGDAEGVREIAKPGERCAPLAEAVAVVLVVLFDLTPRETSAEPLVGSRRAPAPAPLPAPSPLPASTPAAGARVENSGPRRSIGVLLAGGAAYGLLGGAVVGTLSFDARARRGHFELALSGLLAPRRTVEHAPGRALVSLAAGGLAGCAWLGLDTLRPDFGLCVGFLAGRLHAEGRGYLRSETANDAWFAWQASADGRWPLTANLSIGLEISLLVPTRRQEFTVANAGVAFESSPVAGLIEEGPELRFP